MTVPRLYCAALWIGVHKKDDQGGAGDVDVVGVAVHYYPGTCQTIKVAVRTFSVAVTGQLRFRSVAFTDGYYQTSTCSYMYHIYLYEEVDGALGVNHIALLNIYNPVILRSSPAYIQYTLKGSYLPPDILVHQVF